MKNLVFTFVFAFAGIIFTNAQSKSDKMYNVFSGKDGVSNFSFSKNMIDAIDLDVSDDGGEKSVTGDLHQVRFMSYNPKKGDLSGSEFIKKATGLLPSEYKKYEEADDEDDDAEIWLLGGKKKFSECHVFINNDEDTSMKFVISFYGDFTVNDIEGLKKTGRGFSDDDQ